MAPPTPALRLAQRLNEQLTRYHHRVELVTACTVPAAGPAILVANHIGYLDPVLIQGACGRFVTWMMTRDFYDLPLAHWFFKALNAIPVDRSGRDLAATRAALRALDHGALLGLFPEGRIEPQRGLLPFHTGVALLAARSGTPIIPVALEGTHRGRPLAEALLTPQVATVAFGKPLRWPVHDPDRKDLEQITNQTQAAVTELLTYMWHTQCRNGGNPERLEFLQSPGR